MAVTTETLKDYLRLSPDSTEDLTMYINAAKAKAAAAGVPVFQNNALYDLFIHELAANYYENRGLSYSGSYQATAEENARKIINSFVLELRHAEDGPAPTPSAGEESEAQNEQVSECG